MKEFAERYEKILQYLKTLSGEQEASSALDVDQGSPCP